MPRPIMNAVPTEFDPVIKFMHWLTLLLIITVFALAFSIDLVPATLKHTFLQLHRSVGLTIWVVTLVRLVWRQFTRFPDWPVTMPRPVRFATNAGEYTLYVLLLIQPVLGLILSGARGERVDLFFLGTLPAVTGPDRAFGRQIHGLHENVGFVLLALIGLHAAAGLYHHYWRRDNTLIAMLPRRLDAPNKQEQGVSS